MKKKKARKEQDYYFQPWQKTRAKQHTRFSSSRLWSTVNRKTYWCGGGNFNVANLLWNETYYFPWVRDDMDCNASNYVFFSCLSSLAIIFLSAHPFKYSMASTLLLGKYGRFNVHRKGIRRNSCLKVVLVWWARLIFLTHKTKYGLNYNLLYKTLSYWNVLQCV